MSYHKSNDDLPFATPMTVLCRYRSVDNGFRDLDLHGINNTAYRD